MPLEEFKKGIRGDPITRAAWVVAIIIAAVVCAGIGYGLFRLVGWVLTLG